MLVNVARQLPLTPDFSFIMKSAVSFYLTGSRYLEITTQYSDWDFFAQYDRYSHNELIVAGFEMDTSEKYNDSLCVAVYRKNNIDIQLVKDADIKQRMQEKGAELLKAIYPNKNLARLAWKTFASMVALNV